MARGLTPRATHIGGLRVFMLVPYKVDVTLHRPPLANPVLIMFTVLASAFMMNPVMEGGDAYNAMVLHGFSPIGLLGHMLLHGGWMHLLGNMLFLWVFGNAVNAKVGDRWYVPIYIWLGLAAALTHVCMDGHPAIGASGAINGIVGMYIVLYPRNQVTCLLWILWKFRTFDVSGYVLLGVFFLFDLHGAMTGGGGVAYFAHVGGFIAGALTAAVLLSLGLVRMRADEESAFDALGVEHGNDLAAIRNDAATIVAAAGFVRPNAGANATPNVAPVAADPPTDPSLLTIDAWLAPPPGSPRAAPASPAPPTPPAAPTPAVAAPPPPASPPQQSLAFLPPPDPSLTLDTTTLPAPPASPAVPASPTPLTRSARPPASASPFLPPADPTLCLPGQAPAPTPPASHLQFTCPNGHVLRVPAAHAGQTGPCPVCGVPVTAPHA
ncbi:MAG: rhomboid family intramembrane serine protease [Phycisphaera sp.]|nr:rhomboid family intramembrane serine protease [Phycisphaera sp.]